jgi:alkylation response protein AidB-like acyl-CoA dehydrogenase
MAFPADAPAQDLLAAARELEDVISRNADQSERDRRLHPETVTALEQAGIFAMAMPCAWGGPETDPLTQNDILEVLGRVDGSASWCAMIGCDGGYFSAYLDDSVGRELFTDISAATVAVVGPGGVAVRQAGGFVVNGQWAFASGSTHAKVFALSCIEMTDSGPRMGANGIPVMRMCLFPRDEVRVLDNWDTTGLRGTASGDVAISGVFVPEARTFVLGQSPPLRPGPLYQYPTLFVAKMPGVPLGIASAALDDFRKLAPNKTAFGGTSKLADSGPAQVLAADAMVTLDMARGGARQVIGELWATLQAGNQVEAADAARMFTMVGAVCQASGRVVGELYRAAGRDGLFVGRPLERRMRDILAVQQHVVAGSAVKEAAGRVFLGRPSGTPFF